MQALCLASNLAMASQTLSGAMIKAEIQSSLASLGIAADPAINQDRQFLPCAADLTIEPMFGSYKTVRVSCSDRDGFSIAVRTQIQSESPVSVLGGDARDASQSSNEAQKLSSFRAACGAAKSSPMMIWCWYQALITGLLGILKSWMMLLAGKQTGH